MTALAFLATVPRGFTDLLAAEITALGAGNVRESAAGVGFQGTLATGYRVLLESRLASRVLLGIARARVTDADELYEFVRGIDWREHMDPAGTLACDFTGHHPAIANTHFGALKVKDGIVDRLRETTGQRPSIDTRRPDLTVHAHAARGEVTLSIDLAGESLSRRGYRFEGGAAPLRENLAAGILLRAGWPAIAAAGGAFLDPMCGSGTFVIEAAWIAAGIAPGLMREWWGFAGWRGHDAALWNAVVEAARARASPKVPVVVSGADRHPAAIAAAEGNARRAGLAGQVVFHHCDIERLPPPDAGAPPGLLCVNPPYGERLAGSKDAAAAHRAIGEALRKPFAHWHAAVLTGQPALGQLLGIEAARVHTVFNGPIECRLLRFSPGQRRVRRQERHGVIIDDASIAASPGARMFANRLKKNLARLGRRARREGVTCWRLYDADMPEYALAVDLYTGAGPDQGRRWLYVQEYAPPTTVDPAAARRRRQEALSVLPEVTGVPFEDIRLRTRRRQKDGQYQRLRQDGEFHVVEEAGLKFRINLDSYLDTGLFLDHRITRRRLGAAAAGKRFLNLFCYTGAATVHAAAGGAVASLSVDLSRTYLDWARANLELNGLATDRHRLLQTDVLRWLAGQKAEPQWDLIFLDPPTFSNSARMQGVLDIQRDHARLIEGCMRILAPEGLLVFSTNARRFVLDDEIGSRFRISDISAATRPFDFEANPRIHRAFEVRHH